MRYNPLTTCSNRPSGTLCLYCENAVPNPRTGKGCPWSIDFEPVPGWDAIPVVVAAHNKKADCNSFCVISCPRFSAEPTRHSSDPYIQADLNAFYSRLTWDDEEE